MNTLYAALIAAFVAFTPSSAFSLTNPAHEIVMQRQIEMVNPSVQVITESGRGSGTVLKVLNKPDTLIIVTNNHVIDPGSEPGTVAPDMIKVLIQTYEYDAQNKFTLHTFEGTVVARSIEKDLAFIEIETKWVGPIANLAPENMPLEPGEDVWAVGGGLGLRPYITYGLLSVPYFRWDMEGIYHIVSSSIVPGNSGGSLWVNRDNHYYMVGVPAAIADPSGGDAISTFGLVIPIDVVRKLALEKLGYLL